MQKLHLNRFPFHFNLILFPNYRSLWDSLNNWTIFSLYLYWLQRRVAPVVAGSGGGACDDRRSALAWCHVEVRRRLLGGCGKRLLLLYGQQRRRRRRRQQPGGDDDDGLTQNSPNIIISTSSLLQLLQRWSLLRAWARERAPPSVLLTRRHRVKPTKDFHGTGRHRRSTPHCHLPGRPATLHGIWTYKIRPGV